ncbi:MAG: hypothetical protein JW809_14095 [Pirellulales bacterium]|nr:hypothetical protein [Pirellulales bacterium]
MMRKSSLEDFRWRLDTIENELRRLPQNLCVLLTHTPLSGDGARYSLFECGDRKRLGTHWRFAGDFVEWGELPRIDQSTDRFPFGVVLSRTASLLDLAMDAERPWLNFGGKGGFYVSDATVRDSLPEGQVTHGLTERTIWHYFAENTGDPMPKESTFESVYEQLLHCYHGIRETCMEFEDQLSLGDNELTEIIYELGWPEVLLYLGLRYPGPSFRVERHSVLRSFQGEELIPWGKTEECHKVFRICPASVARATSYALEALGRVVHAVGEPASPMKADPATGARGPSAITTDEANAAAMKLAKKDPEEVNGGLDRDAALRSLTPAVRQAYLAYQCAERKAEKRLTDRKAYDLFRKEGIPTNQGDLGEIEDYKLPTFDTWSRCLRVARRSLGEQKNTPRAGRPRGRSIVKRNEV